MGRQVCTRRFDVGARCKLEQWARRWRRAVAAIATTPFERWRAAEPPRGNADQVNADQVFDA